MNENNFLRLALVLGDSQASNFKTNLKKIVKLILFDIQDESLTIYQIINEINGRFELVFTEKEVEEVLKEKEFVVTDYKSGEHGYILKPIEIEKIRNKEESAKNIDYFIEKYISEEKSEFEFEAFKKIIYRFLYDTFNSDKKTVLELMHYYDENVVVIDAEKYEASEATVINGFLNWDNDEKNQFILNLIAACFEYCMLTLKKNTSAFSNIFKGKNFYLDTNIIFRLAGFNNKDRKSVMIAFINKCKEAGIQIKYTNVTADEINKTISHKVKTLKNLLGKNAPLNVRAMRTMGSAYNNLDFYDLYQQWYKKGNKPNQFNEFEKYLKKEIRKVLSEFKCETIRNNYDITHNTHFTDYCNDFNKYKSDKYRKTHDESIKVDMKNFFYLTEINDKSNANNFMDLKNYFITADHSLTDWALKVRPGTIPIFVLPSVWYSILLKYRGRTNNDYKAFCQFLNIRIAPEEDKLKDIKEQMLPIILNLDEDNEVKEEIVFDIENQLKNEKIVELDAKTIVENSHKSVTERRLQEQEEKYNKKINSIINEKEKMEQQKYNEGVSEIIKSIAQRKRRRHQLIKKIGNRVSQAIIIIIIAAILLQIIRYGVNKKCFFDFCNEYGNVITVITAVIIPAIRSLFKKLIGDKKILIDDLDLLIEKEYEKYKREQSSYSNF